MDRTSDGPRRPVRRVRCGGVLLALVLAGCAAPTPGAAGPTAERTSTPAERVSTPAGKASAGAAAPVEEVRFDADGLTLAGDLYLPDATGPHPAVVLVHGSGPIDRDATVPGQLGMTFPTPVTIFADLAGALRDAGYAVLTYDKRTCGPFNNCADNGYPRPPDDLTVDAFVADAAAAVAYLRERTEVRPDAVTVAGHSQGAAFVPPLLIDDPELAAGVMLSAAHDPIDELLATQAQSLADLLDALGRDAPAEREAVEQQRQLAEQVRGLRSGVTDDATPIGGASAGFWRSWLRITDGVPDLATQVEQPLLVLGGALDTNVPPAQTQRWRETLTGPAHQVVTLDCVAHALNCLATDDLTALTPSDVGGAVDPRVAATVVEFLDTHVR